MLNSQPKYSVNHLPDELCAYSAKDIAQKLHKRALSSVEVTTAFLKWIEEVNPHLNAFISVSTDIALQQAQAADARLLAKTAGPMTGIPIAHKDLFCTEGIRTSCASKMLDNFIAPYDATVVKKFKEAGMVTLGKTNMDEFAMGSSTESSFYGATKNPWDKMAVPGGSSGGAAAAVAAGMAPVATASDTGGSIRQPASFCGVTGVKPTYGRVSRYGMIAYASSLDQGGVMARSVEDCTFMLGGMAGFDPLDSTSVDVSVPDYLAAIKNLPSQIKIGIPKEWFSDGLQADIKSSIDAALKVFEEMGAIVEEVSLPNTELSLPAYYIIAMSEASSNLAKYDGVRFGHRCDAPQNLEDLYFRTRSEGFGKEVKSRIMLGTYSLSSGYYDDYYLKAQKIRRIVSQDFDKIFKDYDFIMGPVAPTTAFDIGEINDPVQMYLSDIYTFSLNLTGRPGMSVPIGMDARNRPIGMQISPIIGKRKSYLLQGMLFRREQRGI